MNWEEVSKELQAPLKPDAVKPPPQGKYGEYVEALHVIREANRIFGHNGWNYDVKELTLTNSGEVNGTFRAGYLAIVQVTVDGVTRTDVGHGQGFTKQGQGDAHDSAVKEAVTDALKRCLRTFGNTFGLALYEKDNSKREVGYEVTDQERDAAIDAVNNCTDLPALQQYWRGLYTNARHVADDPKVIEAKDYRKSELDRKDAA